MTFVSSEVLLLKALFKPDQPGQSPEKTMGISSRVFIILAWKVTLLAMLADTETELDAHRQRG